MTEQDAPDPRMAAKVKAGPTKPVTFKGREILTVEPTEEQFLAMVRLTKLPSSDGMSGHRMLATMNRVPELVKALCASEVDGEWFEDGLVDSTVEVADLPEFCSQVILAWWGDEPEAPNRASKRAAKKASGARLAR